MYRSNATDKPYELRVASEDLPDVQKQSLTFEANEFQ